MPGWSHALSHFAPSLSIHMVRTMVDALLGSSVSW